MAHAAPRFHIEHVVFAERDVVLRLPFRFGAVTVTACPQVYVRARIRFEDGRTSEGCAAEMMIPKWFDKNPALSNEQNFEQLRQALRNARDAYTAPGSAQHAWDHFAEHYDDVLATGLRQGLLPLVASYGPALIDRAVLDAVCLHLGCGFADAMAHNVAGIDLARHALAPDLQGFDLDGFLARTRGRRSIAARHTVGLADAIRDADLDGAAPHDGLPASLEGAIARYGHCHFKLKLSGDTRADIDRLTRIADLIDGRAALVTLDGNEQYADVGAFSQFLDAFLAAPRLQALAAKTAFIEQPIQRAHALERDVRVAAARLPLLVDESDATLDSFLQARALGYTGVSSKSCKGFYKSIVNAARCAQARVRGEALFLSGEDLTMQAGVGLQQDLALVGWLGLDHVERNGHHYVDGMAALPPDEQRAFATRHPALYADSHGAVRLRIVDGQIDLSSLGTTGFATGERGAGIRWDAMGARY
jgi:L-alanine-DL-glutamate epimerase-like enolase superfamily enzyme